MFKLRGTTKVVPFQNGIRTIDSRTLAEEARVGGC